MELGIWWCSTVEAKARNCPSGVFLDTNKYSIDNKRKWYDETRTQAVGDGSSDSLALALSGGE
jgi:hypothetical protein